MDHFQLFGIMTSSTDTNDGGVSFFNASCFFPKDTEKHPKKNFFLTQIKVVRNFQHFWNFSAKGFDV